MPLKKGRGKAAFHDNVRELVKAGHSPKQAVAIAYKEAGEGKGVAGRRKRR